MSTLNPREIDHFESMAGEWWDVNGPAKPLHKLNPVRLAYIKRQICTHFDRDADTETPLQGLSILDIGCGGGLVSEPLASFGGTLTGLDAGEKAIYVAKQHAEQNNLDIQYHQETSSDHQGEYDVVLALEILEHVADKATFINDCIRLCKPGGMIIVSTLNRTAKSYALGIVAAEYILRWLPRGTHDWQAFTKPSELARLVRPHNAEVKDISGLIYNPFTDQFTLSSHDIDVNYFMAIVAASSAEAEA